MYLKELSSTAAIAITFIAFLPYIRGILRSAVQPHVFSWVIWGITTIVVFFAQLQAKGGVGAWPVGLSGLITIGIAVLAFLKRADVSVTRSDWLFFSAALASLPFWYFTADPLWTVVILTCVDVLGFGPTARKVWQQPWSESMVFYLLYVARNVLVLVALESYSLTTVLFPAAIGAACLLMTLMVKVRRMMLV